jgi:NCAIR mutase (PurE)-related protein
MARTNKLKGSTPLLQMLRLKEKIINLGGEIPDPVEWAIIKRTKRKGVPKVIVDSAIYNNQLLETLEDLQKKQSAKMDSAIAATPNLRG